MAVFFIQRAGKPYEASSVYSSDKMDWPRHKPSSCEVLSQNKKDSLKMEKGKTTFTLFIYFLCHSSPPLCFPRRPLHNINMHSHESVAGWEYDCCNTMKGRIHKGVGNIFYQIFRHPMNCSKLCFGTFILNVIWSTLFLCLIASFFFKWCNAKSPNRL